MNESTLKALSLIAAELHLNNLMTITISQGIPVDYSCASEINIQNLADHFSAYFSGGSFSPGSVLKPVIHDGNL